MPLYEYQCDSCNHRFEVIQKFSDPLVSICPNCAGPVQKLLSSPAIQFKGSGFYLTDYGRGGKSDSANAKAGKSDGASGGESKPDSSGSGTKSESGSSPVTSEITSAWIGAAQAAASRPP